MVGRREVNPRVVVRRLDGRYVCGVEEQIAGSYAYVLSKIAKLLFVATSLAPVLAAFAVKDLTAGRSMKEVAPWLVVTALLPVICWLLLLFSRKHLEQQELRIVKIKSTDKEVLAYLIAYLLPLLTKDTVDVWKQFPVAMFVFGMIFLAVYHSNAFHFNPLLGCVGYHFYEVECDDGMTYLFITGNTIKKQDVTSDVVQMADYIFLEVTRK